MPKFCPNCSFDLSSVMIRTPTSNDEVSSPEVSSKKQAHNELEEEAPVKIVKVREPSKKQAEHLAKARVKAKEAIAAKKEKLKQLEDQTNKQSLQPMFLF